jgi:hypothetical protein
MLTIPKTLSEHTKHKPLLARLENSRYGDEITLKADDLDDALLGALDEALTKAGNKSLARVTGAIIAARAGDDTRAIPRLIAAPEMILAYLRRNLTDGWLYKRGVDGHLHAWLVTGVKYVEARQQGASAYVEISLVANGQDGRSGRDGRRTKGGSGLIRSTSSLGAENVSRKRVSQVLEAAGILVETPALRADYDAAFEEYVEVINKGFAEQYRFSGVPFAVENYRIDGGERVARKVVQDLHPSEVKSASDYAPSALFSSPGNDVYVASEDEPDDEHEGTGPVPVQFVVPVFDLHSHDFITVNTRDLTRYEYDPTLREKIVLPADQRNLLDILTGDLDDFTGDVIEGKSAGNVVLCKGSPGVGKTLTAEVYSELIARPLYSIHSGNLGITADKVRENLEEVFTRAARWNAVLLLDEADVFVLERGDNLQQNAIVAEFLRTLEYFDGLMFMTTNRANNIDDAILSRAAAIIDYKVPDLDGIRAVWQVQARHQQVTIPDDLLDDLVHGFVEITPRDVKMLLRLALRVAKSNGVPLNAEIVGKCAMFRGLHFSPGARTA